jgi:transposase InsO family protein
MRVFKKIKKIEIYKFGIISPVLHGSEDKQNKYFERLHRSGITIPPGSDNVYFLKPSTFKSWLRKYREKGLKGLMDKDRSDKGKPRKWYPELAKTIKEVKEEWNLNTIQSIYRKLIELNHINEDDLSYESLRRYINQNRLLLKEKKGGKKFEKELFNELWMVDFKEGKRVRDGKKLMRTFLCAIIDDSTRMILGYEWGFFQDSALFSRVFKRAVTTYGIPQILYADCGKVFKSDYIVEICGRLDIALINTAPYSPEQHGKIERFNRTVKQMFYPMIKDFHAIDMEELNRVFCHFIDNAYHKNEHSSLNESPLSKFHRLLPRVKIRRLDDEKLKSVFQKSIARRVRKDSTVRIKNIYYEVEAKYVGERIEIRYPLDRPDEYSLYENDQLVGRIYPVNLVENANPPVSNYFSKLKKKGGK